LYVEAAEYSPLGAHLQIIASFSVPCKFVSRTSIQRFSNSQSWWLDVIFWTVRIQLLFVSSFATVLFLKWAILKRLGAISLGVLPWSHLSCQKSAFSPFPRLILVEAWKRDRSILLPWLRVICPVIPKPSLPKGSAKTG
jgi:hypothetical protein